MPRRAPAVAPREWDGTSAVRNFHRCSSRRSVLGSRSETSVSRAPEEARTTYLSTVTGQARSNIRRVSTKSSIERRASATGLNVTTQEGQQICYWRNEGRDVESCSAQVCQHCCPPHTVRLSPRSGNLTIGSFAVASPSPLSGRCHVKCAFSSYPAVFRELESRSCWWVHFHRCFARTSCELSSIRGSPFHETNVGRGRSFANVFNLVVRDLSSSCPFLF